MKRRTLVATLASVAIGSTAGCSGGSGGDETTTTEPTTATETSTPAATPTATGTPAPPIHGLDEPFVVGEGDHTIPYTVSGLYVADRIGHEGMGETADNGRFLIVILSIENVTDQTIDVPTGNLVVRGEGVIAHVDQAASETVASDDRINVPSLALATVPSGETRTGALLYDVSPDNSYRLRVTPTGDRGEVHYVSIGPIGDLRSLERAAVN